MEYIDLLREYSNYNDENIDYKCEYLIDKNIEKIKEQYKIEQIAGQSSELSKIKNLLKWIHNKLNHNGSHNTPKEKHNICGIIEDGEKNGASCYSLSIALSEAYLALGLKSKFVRCMPMDYKDGDCHVVVHVYSNELNKWIMVDPTFESYFIDIDQNILSLDELREKFINGEVILVNDEINYNGMSYDKDEYIKYMAKNTFKFEYLKINSYNSANLDNNTQIQLVPLGYDGKLNDLKNLDFRKTYISEHFNLDDSNVIENFKFIDERKDNVNIGLYINNKDIFWKA